MNIYFCGSIKGGRQHADWYAELIAHMKKYGNVLTEHVGDVNYAGGSPQNVYVQDTDWLCQSDIVVADVTVTSMGVGYELAFAEAHGKPCLVLFDNKFADKISYMISGNSYFKCFGYDSHQQAIEIFEKFLQENEGK